MTQLEKWVTDILTERLKVWKRDGENKMFCCNVADNLLTEQQEAPHYNTEKSIRVIKTFFSDIANLQHDYDTYSEKVTANAFTEPSEFITQIIMMVADIVISKTNLCGGENWKKEIEINKNVDSLINELETMRGSFEIM